MSNSTESNTDGSAAKGHAIMWFRRDLRINDLPALAEAASAKSILPCFIFDDRLITGGRFPSSTRTDFMLGCLEELRADLRELGADLVLRRGLPEKILVELATETGSTAVHWTTDISPFAKNREKVIGEALADAGITAQPNPGAYIVDDPGAIRSGSAKPYTVFSPYAKVWREVERRELEQVPEKLDLPHLPSGFDRGELPTLKELGLPENPSTTTFQPGEKSAREAAQLFRNDGITSYDKARDSPIGGSSRLSPYLRWGCVSPLELETKLGRGNSEGHRVFRTELAWREFYASVLDNFPEVTEVEFQKRYRGTLAWQSDEELFEAWMQGRTGYPLIDAGMRELLGDSWMHNRVRMVVASFLTKDLHLDWRLGEAWFMERLIDGDIASNNGGWQWVTSVGTDPAPYFQRMFNPMTQQEKFDPTGEYVRKWIPELANVPDAHLVRPWLMDDDAQDSSGCLIGTNYPQPIIDHAEERRFAIERYRAAVD